MKSTPFLLISALFTATVAGFGMGSGTASFYSASKAPVQTRGQMTMRARNCDLLGKKPNRKAMSVSFSHKRNHKVQHVNLQWKRYDSEKLGRRVRMRLSTKGIKTVQKYGGIDAAAEKLGVDLSQF